VKLSRPLDWLVVSDHSDAMGEPMLKDWHDRLNTGGDTALAATMEVIELPTPRWTAYDAFRFGTDMPKDAPTSQQERAYTSPIWYTP
jgi:hypothetical protein